MVIRAVAVTTLVLVAVSLGSGAALARRGRVTPPVDPPLAARAGEDRAVGGPLVLPDGREPRVLLVGDSVAATLAVALALEADHRGFSLRTSVHAGCGILRGLPTTRDGFTPPWASSCERAVADWRADVARTPADVVLLLSTWDGSSRLLDGAFVDPADASGRATMVALFHEVVDAVAPAGSGRFVVLLAEAMPTHGAATGDASPARLAEARRHLTILRTVAREDLGRVRVVDFNQWLCPTGAPCPEVVDGVIARPDDGGHLSGSGAAWLAPRLLDAIGLTPR